MSSIVMKGGSGEPVRPWAVDKAVAPGNETLVASLRSLLADVVVVYLTAHGFHWNVKGQDFNQYHALFASIYEDTYGSVDDLAENILKLGADAPFNLTQFSALRTIPDTIVTDDPAVMAADLLSKNDALVMVLKRVFDVANSVNEQGVANFIAERIDAHQKWSWQLRASLGQQ